MIELPCSARLALRPTDGDWEILDKSDWTVAGQVRTDSEGVLQWLEIERARRGEGLGTEAFLRLARWQPQCVPRQAAGPGRWLRRLGYEGGGSAGELSWSGSPADSKTGHSVTARPLHDPRIRLPKRYAARRGLVQYTEPEVLCEVGLDHFGRRLYLAPGAAHAWREMAAGALTDGVLLEAVSGFRSVGYQEALLARKLDQGQSLEQILAVSAAPGYSEHHSGRALDLTTSDADPLSEQFERTDAFQWLSEKASRFGFSLSYPRDNRHGFVFEPWHWAFHD